MDTGHLRLAVHALDGLHRPRLHPLPPGPVHGRCGPAGLLQGEPAPLRDEGRLPHPRLHGRAGRHRGARRPHDGDPRLHEPGRRDLLYRRRRPPVAPPPPRRREPLPDARLEEPPLGARPSPGRDAPLRRLLPRQPRHSRRCPHGDAPLAMAQLDSKVPQGELHGKWLRHKASIPLVNPSNKRKYEVIVVGAGLAGASASATLSELGYRVSCFVFHDSPRRAHSIAAQGGINAAKNYQNDGDSVHRLFYDTVKGGDYRSREANVHRLAEVSVDIIDQCTAMGVPFAREYGGTLANRSFGGAQVSRTFYARGQTGQQLLLGVYAALERQIGAGKVVMFSRSELLDIVIVDRGRACGVVVRDLVTGAIRSHAAHAVVLATG